MQCFKNAQEINEIAVLDRAFHYGDGCFTTARIVDGQLQLAARHYTRLKHACQQLYLEIKLDYIEQSLQHLSANHKVVNGTVKIIVSRGVGQRGYSLPDTAADLWLFYYPNQFKAAKPNIIKSTVLHQTLGFSMPALVGLKTLNRLDQVILKKELDDRGFIEALVCDVNQNIVEGVSSNCFMLMNGQWITPKLGYNGVHGVLRAEILDRMQHAEINCQVRNVASSEIQHIQALFFCNALNPMQIVSALDDRSLDTETPFTLFHHLQLDQIR